MKNNIVSIDAVISRIEINGYIDEITSNITKENTRKNFMRQYKNYQRDLANYKSSNPVYKDKYEKTLYPELPKKDTSYLRFIPKILRRELPKGAA